jgi:geranylgeranyl diphosphate synthase type II
MHDAKAILEQAAQRVTRFLDLEVGHYAGAPPRLLESIRYSLMAGGKRIRPALVLESCRACADGRPAEAEPAAAAAAIELIHTFSLVHDDLPAMDDDDLRRGRPTNHKVFGEAMAILAGDAMVIMAFELLARATPSHLAAPLIHELASAAGPQGMIGGQVLDMEGEHRELPLEDLQALHARKTGALLTCACRMGAICAGGDGAVMDAVTIYGRHLGLAFQIVDDLLDVTATAEQLGKATHKDAGKGKNTYPALLGIEGARSAARQQLDAALRALEPLGPAADGLRSIGRFVVERSI